MCVRCGVCVNVDTLCPPTSVWGTLAVATVVVTGRDRQRTDARLTPSCFLVTAETGRTKTTRIEFPLINFMIIYIRKYKKMT